MEEKSTSTNLLIFIVFFGVFLKLALAYFLPIYHDVGWYAALANYHDSAFMNLAAIEHPPFGYYPYLLFMKLFGIDDFILRLVPFFFSLLELWLMYLIAKKWFGRETATATLILFSLTYYATINALSPEGDGSIMGLISLALFYCWYEYYSSKDNFFLYWSGIFLGITFLIKVREVLFFLPLFCYSFYKTRKFFETIKDVGILAFFSLLIFSIFPILVFLANPESAETLLYQVVLHNTGTSSLSYKITHPFVFFPVGVVFMFLFPFLISLGIKKRNDASILLLLWFLLFFVLLTLLPEGLASAYPRYIAFLVPPAILLSARGLASLHFNKKELFFILLGTFFLSALFVFFNQIFHERAAYWYFQTAAMGIVKVAKILLISTFLSSLFLLFLYFICRNNSKKKMIVSFFLIIGFSFNLMLIVDPIIDTTHREIIDGFIKYYHTHDIKEPIFVWADDIAFYLGQKGYNIAFVSESDRMRYARKIGYNESGYFFPYTNDPVSMKVLKQQGGTVFTLYYPLKYTLDTDPERKKEYNYLVSHCIEKESFDYLHGKGAIFEC